MKIHIMHKTKIYRSTDEVYSWAAAFATRGDAERAIRAEIASDVDAESGDDGVGADAKELAEKAFAEGADSATHDAVLRYGDFVAYYDVTESGMELPRVRGRSERGDVEE